jgi:hypothetical protein
VIYRTFTVLPARDNPLRWRVYDRGGTFMVERPSQDAACAWIDRYAAFLLNQQAASERPPWRGKRP